MQRFNVPGCQKKIFETDGYVMTTFECLAYLATQNRNINFLVGF